MKKTVFFLILASFSGRADGQVLISLLLGDKLNSEKLEFGLEGGMNWYSINGLESAGHGNAFNLGFYFDIRLKDPQWMVNTGVMVKSRLGAGDLPVYSLSDPLLDSAFVGGHVDRKINYFNVPIMIKYRLGRSLYAKAGVQLGLRSKAKDEFYNEISADDDLSYTVDIRENYHRLDAGLALGFGYRLMKGQGMNFGLQYYLGLANVSSIEGQKQYNRSLYLTMGIPIGKGKAKDVAAPSGGE